MNFLDSWQKKHSFATVTGRGPHPIDLYVCNYICFVAGFNFQPFFLLVDLLQVIALNHFRRPESLVFQSMGIFKKNPPNTRIPRDS